MCLERPGQTGMATPTWHRLSASAERQTCCVAGRIHRKQGVGRISALVSLSDQPALPPTEMSSTGAVPGEGMRMSAFTATSPRTIPCPKDAELLRFGRWLSNNE